MQISIKAARVNAGLTQKQAGEAINISREAICAIESGKRTISVIEMDGLCAAYGCSRDDIILPYNPTLSGS